MPSDKGDPRARRFSVDTEELQDVFNDSQAARRRDISISRSTRTSTKGGLAVEMGNHGTGEGEEGHSCPQFVSASEPRVQSKKQSQSETKPSEFLRPQDSQSHINPVPDIISESKSKDVSMESSLTSELQSSPGSDEDERQHTGLRVNEDAIGLYEVPSTTSATLTEVLKDTLIRCDLPLSNCRGQGYDSASNFQGHVNGVAVQLQGEEPRAVHVHCLAHCINLALQEATRACKPLRDALDITIEVNKLIKYSPKREHLFKNLQKAPSIEKRLDMDVPQTERTRGLRPLCPTRWRVRTGSINSVLENFDTLRKAFEEINKGHDENARIAGGLLSQFDQFSVPFGLKVSSQIFGASGQLSSSIQSVETTAKDARKGAEQVLAYYDKLRSTDTFSEFYKSVVDEAEDKTDPPRLPRYRKRPTSLDDGSNTHTFPSVEDYCRQQYFEGLGMVSEQLKRRFSQKGFETAVEIEQLLLSAANGRNFQISSHIRELYKDDVDFVRLN
ncbi:zinc finger MYM-type protein 1-like [Haliotis rubra]|uniref:zinc finger MYM-type protein 1-like n=1 Tax=Haliotis rubra TaxID=36100 RepID=UPI001EE58216|nr:zinc finger MYM-type protein 1-like [Haliotis rubra]